MIYALSFYTFGGAIFAGWIFSYAKDDDEFRAKLAHAREVDGWKWAPALVLVVMLWPFVT